MKENERGFHLKSNQNYPRATGWGRRSRERETISLLPIAPKLNLDQFTNINNKYNNDNNNYSNNNSNNNNNNSYQNVGGKFISRELAPMNSKHVRTVCLSFITDYTLMI